MTSISKIDNTDISVICIGGGPAGLTAGYALAKVGRKVLVLEADPAELGGIARTVRREGYSFDIGGHRFFSKSDEITALWKEILGPDLLVRSRKSRIFYQGKFYPYPLNVMQTLANLGLVESLRCGISYLTAKLCPIRQPRNFEEWVTNQFGARLYTIFFKTYTEKVWGVPCRTISADWAAQRIKGLSLASAVLNALGIRGRGQIKSLIESFLYPRLGPGMLWERAAQWIQQRGGEVRMNARVEQLRYRDGQWHVTCADGSGFSAPQVISSMPLSALVFALENVPEAVKRAASSLRYRDFLMVALVVPERNAFDDNWLYIHAPEVKVGRIQNFKQWSPEMVPDDKFACYGMEYFCFENDSLWNADDKELAALASRELETIGLAKQDDVRKAFVVRQPKAYPVYDHAYQDHVAVIRDYLATLPGLQVAGRNGMHKYNNQDHSMMTALLCVRNILEPGARFDVWNVNQDAQYHEESGASGERSVPLT